MRWGELGDLADLLCSLTKVWISQHSAVTLQPSSSRSGSRHAAKVQTKRARAWWQSGHVSPSLSITTNTRRSLRERDMEREREKEREEATDHSTHHQLMMRSPVMADPQNKWLCVASNRTWTGYIHCMCAVTEFSVACAASEISKLNTVSCYKPSIHIIKCAFFIDKDIKICAHIWMTLGWRFDGSFSNLNAYVLI